MSNPHATLNGLINNFKYHQVAVYSKIQKGLVTGWVPRYIAKPSNNAVAVIAGKGRNRSFCFPAAVKLTLRPNAGEEGRTKAIGSLPMAKRTKSESDSGREFGFSDVRLTHLGAKDKA